MRPQGGREYLQTNRVVPEGHHPVFQAEVKQMGSSQHLIDGTHHHMLPTAVLRDEHIDLVTLSQMQQHIAFAQRYVLHLHRGDASTAGISVSRPRHDSPHQRVLERVGQRRLLRYLLSLLMDRISMTSITFHGGLYKLLVDSLSS